MTGLDAKFLYSETPTAHMHTVKVAVADLSDIEGGFTFEEFVEVLGVQLDHLPPFRRRAVPVPGRLGHPVWVEDPDFEIRRHVARMVLPAPGDRAQLAAVVGEFASLPLKRDRPLWELLFVEGLAEGRMAVVVKLHHAVADGTAVVALLHSVVRGMSDEPPDEHEEDPWRPEPIPDRRQLLKMAYRDHVTRWKGMPRLVGRSVRGAKASELRRRSFPVRPPLPLHRVPRTSLNVSLTAERTFAMTTLPMEDLKAIRRAAGTTLNDVYLAVCAGAIRRYLEGRGELPSRSLLASVPVSTDPNVARVQGNRVDNLYVSIGTDLADPAERLAHINTVTKAAKEVRSVLGHELFEQRADVVPPHLYGALISAWTHSHAANRLPPPLNAVLSNVAGPRERIFFGPIQLESLYSVGPILEGIGLNITAWSYVDDLGVSVLGCPASLPDPWQIVDELHAALDELRVAAGPSALVGR
ncbi:MAG: WS/DGAT/MGAT family O-acyltransferase [Acidimicrobiales bacterium]